MNYTRVSVNDFRNNLADYMARTKIGQEVFVVEKWGDVSGYFVPKSMFEQDKIKDIKLQARRKALRETAGIWKDRKDWKGKTSVQIVQELRDKEEDRHGDIFS